jgi:cysteinyl-tRNA synthetase
MDKVLGVMDRGEEIPEEVGSLVDERTEARKERDWARADEIRDRLKQMGWEVKDGPSGTQVRKLKK